MNPVNSYTGKIHSTVYGVFWRKCSNDILISTQFQPEYARSLLPSLDSPKYKSVFVLSVIHRSGTRALSNSLPSEVQQLDGHTMRTDFMPTIQLPTYLYAFAVLPQSFRMVSRITSFGVLLNVHGSPAFERLDGTAELALKCAQMAYTLFHTPLPLAKIDILIIKDTGIASGMENWGLVTLSEDYLMEADDAHAIYLISHEIVHHWIGNLITVNDWKYACLQEDMADFIALKILRALTNSDKRYDRFRLSRYLSIQLAETVSAPSRSLTLPNNITISAIGRHCYLKGVVHLETLEAIVGETRMLKTIRQLLSNHRLGNFNVADVSKYFSDISVDEMFNLEQAYDFWIRTAGFPAVLYERTKFGAKITQLLDSTFGELWPLYLNFNGTPNAAEMMTTATMNVNIPANTLLNLGFLSFYRVNYDYGMWSSIQEQLEMNPETYTVVQRAQLVGDFCYFNAKGFVPNGERLRKRFIEMVYRRPDYYDLCEWYLYWCNQLSTGISRSGSEIVRHLLVDWVASFDNSDHYKCLTGKAVKYANQFCQKVIGVDCL
uniref:Peptidase_M1 domain-containing protein n=1 Tax=Syphacia muris TaxID=451379 RepID=A0A0N5AYZ8_9BILA